MDTLLGNILSFILLYKYVALFVIIYIGSFGIPVPSVAITIAAGAFSGEKFLSGPLVLAIIFISSVLGDLSGYWIARIFEEKSLKWRLFRKVFTAQKRKEVEFALLRHPVIAIVGSRFVGLPTLIVNILAGLTNFPFWRFVFYDLIGELIAAIFYVGLGYVFGNNWQYVSELIEKIGLVIILLVVLALYKPIRKFLPSKYKISH